VHAIIVADLEGVSGVYDFENVSRNNALLTNEVESCILALREKGVFEITVCDSHDAGDSICQKMLKKYGVTFFSQTTGLSSLKHYNYDFAILLGFHGMNGSGGILEHTLRPDVRSVRLESGVEIGEVEILNRWFGSLNIPVILVIGDVEAVREGNYFNPYRSVCCVKGSYFSSPPENYQLIYDKIKQSVESAMKLDRHSCITPDDLPVYVEFDKRDEEVSALDSVRYIGKKTLRYENCCDLHCNFESLIDKLNIMLKDNEKENIAFVKEIRNLVKDIPREMVSNPQILQMLSKNLAWLTADERETIKNYLCILKKEIESNKQ